MTEENREHLKERVYLLLYGLLDEKEAEELRLLMATNLSGTAGDPPA